MNLQELTKQLSDNFQDLQTGKLEIEKAKEISNLAGKLLKGAKLQLEYNSQMKYDKKIEFLEYNG